MRKVIAIDFDGCLCENVWPDIGEPHWDVIDKAIYACAGWGLFFDEANANLPERIEEYGEESRKISADEYWDDKAVLMDGT